MESSDCEFGDELFLVADVVPGVGECWLMTLTLRRLHSPRAPMARYGAFCYLLMLDHLGFELLKRDSSFGRI